MVRRSPDRIADPAIDGEYVDPNVTVSGSLPAGYPITATVQGRRTTTIQAEAVSFHGPLPPPQLLREYGEIIPNGADRIVRMAEAQSAHRIELESIVIKGDDKRANWGLATGFTIGIVMIVLSFILVLFGHDVAGTIMGTTDLTALVGLFIYGRRAKAKELEKRDEKNKALTRRR